MILIADKLFATLPAMRDALERVASSSLLQFRYLPKLTP